MQSQQPFIEQTFKKLECCNFIPIARGSDKCGCGRRYNDHRSVSGQWPPHSSGSGLTRSWMISKDAEKFPTDSYGVIEFQGSAFVRKAQFVRLSFDTPPEHITQLFERYWQLERPKLVISVHGGLTNFELQPKLSRAFTKGLLKAAKTTGTWIITAGLNCGVVNYVASALNQAGGSVRARRRLVSIGIAPWGLLKNRDEFVGRGVTVQYNNKIACFADERFVALNEMHTHFLLVDNCTVGRYGADVILRKKLEKYIGQQSIRDDNVSVGDQEDVADCERGRVPVVGLILEGGLLTIKTVLDYVTNRPPMPVVVCDGSGRSADLLSFAHKYGDAHLRFPDNVKDALMVLIQSNFGYDGDRALDVYNELLQCIRMKHMITVFRLGENKHTDIDHDILAALLKGQGISPMERLSLTLSWNRPDIAASDVFLYGQAWKKHELEIAMMESLMCDRVQFVKLLLEQGVSMEKFVTFRRLEKLYNTRQGPPHTLLYVVKDVVPDVHTDYRIKLPDVGLVIEKLLGGDFQSLYRSKKFKVAYELAKSRTGSSTNSLPFLNKNDEQKFAYPFNDLFIWAVLTKRHTMAKFLWQRGDEGLAKALVAANLYDALAEEAADDYLEAEICLEFRTYSKEFKELSLHLLEQCYQTDAVLGLQLLTYELTNWGNRTCLSLAVSANHMEFLAHPCCQVLLADLWHGGMRIRKRSNLRVLIGLLIPPMLFTVEFKTRDELILQPQTEEERQDVVGYQNNPHAFDPILMSSSDSDEETGLVNGRRRRNTLLARSEAILKRFSRIAPSTEIDQNRTRRTYGAFSRQVSICDQVSVLENSKKQCNKPHTLSCTKRIQEFYQAPITTFWSWTIAYLVFLCFYTYFVLLRIHAHVPTVAEWYTITYVLVDACEMLRRFCFTDGKTFAQKFKIFFCGNLWHLSTAVAIIAFFVAVALRFNTPTLQVARILYAMDLVFWFVHLLDILSINNKLGPYITMIAKMVVSMFYIVIILIIALLAYGVFRQSLLYPNEDQWTWDFLRNVTYKPYFMWYGEVYANEVDNCREHGTDCVVGAWLSPVALTIYLLITNILLVNLVIAIFNNIFLEVNAMSQTLWKFNRYFQVMEYEQKPWLPPPFTVLYYLYRTIQFICCRRCIGKTRPTFDYRLKLFLKPDDIEKLLDFEEECIEDLQRNKDEMTATSSDIRLQETADRTAFISMKLDDVLSKQAAQKATLQNLELDLKAITNYLSLTTEVTVSSSGSQSPISPPHRKSLSGSQPTSAILDDLALQHELPIEEENEEKFNDDVTRSDGSNDLHRSIENALDRSFSSPWGYVPRRTRRTMSTVSRGSRKNSIIHGNFEYSSIADGIDVADCVAKESEPQERQKSSDLVERYIMTPVSSKCDDTEADDTDAPQDANPDEIMVNEDQGNDNEMNVQ